ncbi:MAG: PAS domain S-box protein, partial [Chlorobiaceae bacterium]|nr:PAS domain S-box protein [Chlorobiaceae bacterium]
MRQEKPEKKMDAVHPGATNESTTFALLDLFSEPCFLMDNEGIILKSNKAFAERFSMLSDECTGRNVYDLLSSTILIHEAVESWRNKAKDVISTGKQESFEDEHDDRNLRHTIYPLCSPDGDIQNLLVIAQDITDLKRSEQVGEFEQAFRKAVIDVIPGTFYLLDSDVRLAAWNSYLRDEIIGKPECEMTGARVLEIIHPEDRSIIQEKMLNVLNLGLEERVEVRIFRKGGPEISWRLMTGKRIILNGKPFLIGMGIDITERKKAENELQKLNRALLAISECNQVLRHADKEEELLREICRIVVEIG